MKDRIEILKGDITKMEVDAIVNAANDDLILGGGVAGAIRRAGGESIQEECNRIGPIPLGEAAVTGAGNLPVRFVIHAASMSLGERTTEPNLRAATRNSLLRAKENNIRTIAFPAIGTGIAMFPIDRCARVMLEEVRAHLSAPTSIQKVYFVLFDERTLEAFRDAFAEATGGPPAAPDAPNEA